MSTECRKKNPSVVNDAAFFKSHQLRLAQEAITRGFEPVIAYGATSEEETLREIGFAPGRSISP